MNLAEKIMGVPMAAPETAAMRRLRLLVITLAATLCIGIVLIGTIRGALGPAVTGGLFAVLLGVTGIAGTCYFVRKSRRDDAWLDQLIAADRAS